MDCLEWGQYGTYPVLVRNRGWMKEYLDDTHYQVCYLALNLDVQMYRMTYDEAEFIMKKTSLATKPDFNPFPVLWRLNRHNSYYDGLTLIP